MPPHLKKISLIVGVMILAYLTFMAIIHHSRELAKTDSEATQDFN
jgi:hypothetical protein